MRFQGVFSVLPTPFDKDGNVDFPGLKRVVDLYVSSGIDGVTALGVTGEVARLDDNERERVLETVLEQVNGRVTVIAGATADGTRTCIQYCRRAFAIHADAVMVSPPRLFKLNSNAVVSHYTAVSSAVDIPIVVQDYPPISGYAMEATLLARIAHEVPRARTIKLEDPPTPFKTVQILKESEGIEIDILGGLGGVYLLEELLAGASGVMTGFAYPEMLVEVVRLFRCDDIERAADRFYSYVPLMRLEFQEVIGMAIRKEVLRMRGALSNASTRAPGAILDPGTRDTLVRLLEWTRDKKGAPWISV